MGFIFGKKKIREQKNTPEQLAIEKKRSEERLKNTPVAVRASQRIPDGPQDTEVQAITRSMQLAYYVIYKDTLALRRYFHRSEPEGFTDSRADINHMFYDALYLAYEHIVKNGNYLYLEPSEKGTAPESLGEMYLTLHQTTVHQWKPFSFKDCTGFEYRYINPLHFKDEDFYYFRDVLLPYMVSIGVESPKYCEMVNSKDLFKDWQMYYDGAYVTVAAASGTISFFRNEITLLPFRGSVPLFYRWGMGRTIDEQNNEILDGQENKNSFQSCAVYSIDNMANIMYQIADQIPPGRMTELSSVSINEYSDLSIEDRFKVFACNLHHPITARCLPPKNDEQGFPIQSGRIIDFHFDFITDSKHVQVRVGAPLEDYKKAAKELLCREVYDGLMRWDNTYSYVVLGNDEPSVFEQIDNTIKQQRLKQAQELESKAQSLRDFTDDDY